MEMQGERHTVFISTTLHTGTHDRKQMWLPDAHLCYLILNAARPCVAVLLHGAATSSAISPQMHQQNPVDAPPESCGTTRIRLTPTESCLHLQRDRTKSTLVQVMSCCLTAPSLFFFFFFIQQQYMYMNI